LAKKIEDDFATIVTGTNLSLKKEAPLVFTFVFSLPACKAALLATPSLWLPDPVSLAADVC
jgi:hypothetical protein